jgi:hypothetical protein
MRPETKPFQCVWIFDHTGFWPAELVGTAPPYTGKAAVRILFVTSLRLPEEAAGLALRYGSLLPAL